MSVTPRIIDSYDGLIAALRARADELDMTRHEIDIQSGLPAGYTGKLFGAAQVKKLGRLSLGCVLGALGCQLLLIEDTRQTDRIVGRRQPRERPVRQRHDVETALC